jgi:uncharacterized membrane protein
MANDQLLGLFILLTIYLMAIGRPYLSSCMFSMGLSLKAGGLLLIPALLGSIQYAYGLRQLITSIVIIVLIQYSLGYVFFMRDWDSYWIRSRIFGAETNDMNVGASFDNTVYWNFLSREVYYSNWFTDWLKVLTLVFNVYHFFIR